uniref:G-protein coupled receptors family 1 profile domain-containing protein n=1 Tax=Bubo bubo TaxID=30461 RepID=A0A8C0FJC9_BUBBB
MIASTIEFFTPFITVSRLSLHKLNNQSLNLSINQDLPPLQMEVETKSDRNGFYKTTESICNATSRVDISNTMANRFRLSRDKRVAKSLAIIVCVFGLCWAPYTLLMIIRAACHGHCVQYSLYETSFWLLWVNSAINPVLYPLCHMSFRKAFIKLLCPGKAKIHPHIFILWNTEITAMKGKKFSKFFGKLCQQLFSGNGALVLKF